MEQERANLPYGFDLTPDDHALLRGAPPARALRWAAEEVGPHAKVTAVHPLAGGTSSAMHAVDVEDARGRVRELVLRRFVKPDWLEEEPDAPRREAAALEIVSRCRLPTPALVAVDPRGQAAGEPALLMTRLHGSVEWSPAELEPFLRRLAEVLPEIHATPGPFHTAIPAYAPYALELQRPPSWARRPDLWLRAFELFDGAPPTRERSFIHRDYHPGNVLWRGGEVSGVVDWVHASIGSPLVDVGHCRGNLADALGLEAADRFLELYLAIAGRDDWDPYWDIVAALGGMDDEAFAAYKPHERAFIERALQDVW